MAARSVCSRYRRRFFGSRAVFLPPTRRLGDRRGAPTRVVHKIVRWECSSTPNWGVLQLRPAPRTCSSSTGHRVPQLGMDRLQYMR